MIAFGGLTGRLTVPLPRPPRSLRLHRPWAKPGALARGTSGGRDAGAGDPVPGRYLRLSRDGEPVLDGFDLTIPAGSSLAIVGQNGAGKTTLAKLLCRLYDPQDGVIEVDGVDLRDSIWTPGAPG